eukprot:m.9540 g.9540  ORF g.9540 m.9540 type:complete len:202 (+) comp4080_c0_seq1:109-714(+)
MPLIVFEKEHKEHLKFLTTVDTDVVLEFARISMEFLRTGVNPKVFTGAGKKLQVPPTTVQHGVEGMMFLLTECSKLMISELDFHDSIVILGFPDELNQALLKHYLDNREELRVLMGKLSMQLPSYRSMKWRLDALVASRAMRNQTDPIISMEIETTNPNSEFESLLLQTDPTTLLRITQELDSALKAYKSSHYRRITRAIK